MLRRYRHCGKTPKQVLWRKGPFSLCIRQMRAGWNQGGDVSWRAASFLMHSAAARLGGKGEEVSSMALVLVVLGSL